MAAYRFIHAADIHLDSPLRSLALRNPDLAGLISNATRQSFVRVVDLCLEEGVDALLLAGDLYDGDQTSMKTARFLADQMRRLHQAGVRVYVIRGNHDALSRITRELVFPETVKVFGGNAEAVAVDRAPGHVPVAIHGLSFSKPQAPESLLAKYRKPVDGAVNIGLLHTSLAGAPGHDHYAPCSLADLHGSGFRYWALGHVHKRAVNQGAAAVVMPGMPQGRDINEAGPKSVTLVTVGADRAVTVEERHTSIAQFERVEVDVGGLADWRDLPAAIAAALEEARAATASEHLVARLRLSGVTPLAWQIRRDHDLATTEAETRAAATGATWIEKLVLDVRPPERDAGEAADPLSELRRLMDAEVMDSDGFRAELLAAAEELRNQLPPECRALFGRDEAGFRAMLDAVAEDGAADVLARLHAAATP